MLRLFAIMALLQIPNAVLAQPDGGDPPKIVTIIHAGKLLAVPGVAPRDKQSVIVRSNKIVGIRDGYASAGDIGAKGAAIIDLKDKFVLPGLMDMHVHLQSGGGGNPMSLTDADIAFQSAVNARRTLMAGFTTVRDTGARSREGIIALRRAINRHMLPGPRIFAVGRPISATAGHGDKRFLREDIAATLDQSGLCDGPAACRKAVRTQYKFGADAIKIMASGGGSEPNGGPDSPPEMMADDMRAAVVAAHALGLVVAAHAHGTRSIKAAIRAGVDSVEHSTYMDDETIRLYLEHGTYLVPTIYLRTRYFLASPRIPEATKELMRRDRGRIIDGMRTAFKKGVKIAMGTDAGIYPHGDNAEEIIDYVNFLGVSEMDAIKTATVNAADLMHKSDEIGSIAAGKTADVIATDGNPLKHIEALRTVIFVMHDGRIYKGGG